MLVRRVLQNLANVLLPAWSSQPAPLLTQEMKDEREKQKKLKGDCRFCRMSLENVNLATDGADKKSGKKPSTGDRDSQEFDEVRSESSSSSSVCLSFACSDCLSLALLVWRVLSLPDSSSGSISGHAWRCGAALVRASELQTQLDPSHPASASSGIRVLLCWIS